MSNASDVFAQAIQDAENLLKHFNSLNTKPLPPETEVLKRAGLVMAMTAWETYVEDRIEEATAARISRVEDAGVASFVQSKLAEEIKRLHNPTAEKTLQLFREYAGVDLSEAWRWNNYESKAVRERLNHYLKLRGDVVHRSRIVVAGPPVAHPVTKDELEKAIRFLKSLVTATELGLAQPMQA